MSEELTSSSERQERLPRLREKSRGAPDDEIARERQELDPETWTPDVIHKTMKRELDFWRRAYAATLDPARIEAVWTYADTMEPYCDWPVPSELQEVTRKWWVTDPRSPAIDDCQPWVSAVEFAVAHPEVDAREAIRAALERQAKGATEARAKEIEETFQQECGGEVSKLPDSMRFDLLNDADLCEHLFASKHEALRAGFAWRQKEQS